MARSGDPNAAVLCFSGPYFPVFFKGFVFHCCVRWLKGIRSKMDLNGELINNHRSVNAALAYFVNDSF